MDSIFPISQTYPTNSFTYPLIWYRFETISPFNYGSFNDLNSISSNLLIQEYDIAYNGSLYLNDSNATLYQSTYDMFSISFWSKGNYCLNGLKTYINITSNLIVFEVSSNIELYSQFNDIDNWHHYTFAFSNNSQQHIYIDGISIASNNLNQYSNRELPCQTLINMDISNLRDFRIYNDILNSYDIICSINNVNANDIDGLEVLYHFYNEQIIYNYMNPNLFTFIIDSGIKIISDNTLEINTNFEENNFDVINNFLKKLDNGFTISWYSIGKFSFKIDNVIKTSINSNKIEFFIKDLKLIKSFINDNKKHHWCFRYNQNRYMSVHMDGYKLLENYIYNSNIILSEYSSNLRYELCGKNYAILEDFRIYNRMISDIELQRIYYEFPDYIYHTDDLWIWHKFDSESNLLNNYNISSSNYIVNNNYTLNNNISLETNYYQYLFTHPLNEFLDPIIFTKGYKHVLKWPSSNDEIKLSFDSNFIIDDWIYYKDYETHVNLPIDFNSNIYWFSSNYEKNTVTVLEGDVNKNELSILYWYKKGSYVNITQNESSLINIETSSNNIILNNNIIHIDNIDNTLWYNICFTFSYDNNFTFIKTYFDGILLNTDVLHDFNIILSQELLWNIGKRNAYMKDFRVYTKCLTYENITNMLMKFEKFENYKIIDNLSHSFTISSWSNFMFDMNTLCIRILDLIEIKDSNNIIKIEKNKNNQFYTFVFNYYNSLTKLSVYIDGIFKSEYIYNFRLHGDAILRYNNEEINIYDIPMTDDDVYRLYYNKILINNPIIKLHYSNNSIYNHGILNTKFFISNDLDDVIKTTQSSYYSGKNNIECLSWITPTGNEYVRFDANAIINKIIKSNEFTITFKQKNNKIFEYNVFSIYSNQTKYIDIKTPDKDGNISIRILDEIYKIHIIDIDNIWISWVFTIKISNNRTYIRIYRDGYIMGKKIIEKTLIFPDKAVLEGRIGPFLGDIMLENIIIYDKLLSYANISQTLKPYNKNNKIEIHDVENNEVVFNLDDMFYGTNIKYSIDKNPYFNARIDKNKAKINGSYKGYSYDIVWKASNNYGEAYLISTIHEKNE